MRASFVTFAAAALAMTAGTASAQEGAAVDLRAAPAGVYAAEKTHAYITFSYNHLGYSRPMLRWRDWSGSLKWDPKNPQKSTISVDINAASIDSGVDVFDGHLRGESFFDVENFPNITFVSKSLAGVGETTGQLTGDLTIKGVTKPVTLDVVLNKAANDDFAKAYKLGFSATGTVKRSDFGLERYAPAVSDEVQIVIEAEFFKPRDDKAAKKSGK